MVSPLLTKAAHIKDDFVKDVGYVNYTDSDILIDNNEIITAGLLYSNSLTNQKKLVLSKYDKDGQLIWQEQEQKNTNLQNIKRVIKSSNGYVVLANVKHDASDNSDTLGESVEYGLIMWFDQTGKLVNQKKFEDASKSIEFTDIILTNDGYLVVGNSENNNDGKYQGILIKYDFEGNITKRISKQLDEKIQFFKIIETSINHYIIGGELDDNIILYEYENGQKELTTISNNLNKGAFADLIKTSDNCYLVVSIGGLDINNFIYKIDQNYNIIWQKEISFDETKNNYYNKLFEYNNEYYLFNYNAVTEGDSVRFIKYDHEGNLIYDENSDIAKNKIIHKIQFDNNGHFFALGNNVENNQSVFAKYSILNEYTITINNKTANSTISKSYVQGDKIDLKELLGDYDEISITDEDGNKINFEDGILVMPGCNIIITITTEITENPHTGNLVSIIIASVGVIGAIGILSYTKRKNKFIK